MANATIEEEGKESTEAMLGASRPQQHASPVAQPARRLCPHEVSW